MNDRPNDLADQLKLLRENMLAIEVHLAQISAVVAHTKRQLDALRPSPFPARTFEETHAPLAGELEELRRRNP